jgi:hypothetical protein
MIVGAELRVFSAIEANGAILIEDEKDCRLPRETLRRSASVTGKASGIKQPELITIVRRSAGENPPAVLMAENGGIGKTAFHQSVQNEHDFSV